MIQSYLNIYFESCYIGIKYVINKNKYTRLKTSFVNKLENGLKLPEIGCYERVRFKKRIRKTRVETSSTKTVLKRRLRSAFIENGDGPRQFFWQ